MDRFGAMQVFVRIAELGSLAAAARRLGLARSAVTRQMAALEAHLGVKLMARSTRRLSLTAAGAVYLEKCRVILNLVETAESEIAAERHMPRGAIRISVPLSYGLKRLAPLLLEFVRRYPDVTLDMDYSDRRVNLIEEGVDLAIRVTSRLNPGDVARRIGHERMAILASPDYLARYGSPRSPAELAHHECLGYTAAENQRWQFYSDGKLESFPVRGQLSANNGDVMVEAACQGLGIACQPEFIAAAALAEGRLRRILAEFPLPELGIYAVLPGTRHVPHRVRVLVDFLAERIGSLE